MVIHVEGSTFNLHKAPLEANSGYLKRIIKCSTEFTLSPPLKITAETFSIVTEFCYGTHIPITPFNVAPLRIAADLLDMTNCTAAHTDNLLQKTETYFRRVVSVNREQASIVLLSSLSLLPEAETTACLVTRCIETLSSMDNGVFSSLDEVVRLPPQDFLVVVESMNQRFTSHDLLYRIVDLYLKKNPGNITEEQKFRICNYIDCTTLSSQLLMHAVQNPRMPLRFLVQAMYVEQLNTRRSIISAANHRSRTDQEHQINYQSHESEDSVTLGAILERDAALRQVAQLKAAMDTTNSRIQSLEKELKRMRKLLHEPENSRNALDSVRSQSFRFSKQNKIERGQIGSVSAASLRFTASKDKIGCSSSSEESLERSSPPEKKLGRRLIDGLKSAFRVSTLVSKKKTDSCDRSRLEEEDKGECKSYEVGKGDVIIIKKNLPNHSQPGIQL